MKKFTNWFTISLMISGWLLLAAQVRSDSGEAPMHAAITATSGQGTVRGAHCNVRSRPSTTAEVVAQLNKGDVVQVLETKSIAEAGKNRDWLRVPLPDSAHCYVEAKLVKDGVVVADSVNVRCGPGTSYHDVGKLVKGDHATALKPHGEWLQIKPTPHCSGWISADLVELAPAAVAAPPAMPVAVPPPITPVPAPAPAAPEVKAISTDPDLIVDSVVKVGIVQLVIDAGVPAGTYELATPEMDRIQHRICFLEAPEQSLSRYEGKSVRIYGTERWRKTERYPTVTVDHLLLNW